MAYNCMIYCACVRARACMYMCVIYDDYETFISNNMENHN